MRLFEGAFAVSIDANPQEILSSLTARPEAKEESAGGETCKRLGSHSSDGCSPVNPVDSLRTLGKNLTEGLKVARFGGGGEITRFVCGFMACEPRLSEVFLAGLPKMLKVHVANEPSGQWLENSIRFSVDEVSGSYAGSGLVLAKLSEVLFVETLRRYINALPPEPDRPASRRT